MNKKFFSLVKNEETKSADINIFGDITSWDFEELGEISAHTLSKQLEELNDVDTINVHISSYGGEVKEGLAIYNALKNHHAKIKTFCDGFACSIASVIFMAGDERIMSKSSALMIHNAWMFVNGNANELRKQADDLDKITQLSIAAYMEHLTISEEELKQMLDNETWLLYDECLEYGFATSVIGDDKSNKVTQSAKNSIYQMIKKFKQKNTDKEVNVDDENKTSDDEFDSDNSNDEIDTNDVSDEDNNQEETEDITSNDKKNKENEDKATEKVIAFFSPLIKALNNEGRN